MADRYQNRSFPADDDYGHDNRRPAVPAESDPLAELARLIGQTDPFGHTGRGAQTVPPDDPVDHFEPQPAPVEETPAAPAGPPAWIQKRMAQSDPPPHDMGREPHPVLRRAAVYPDNEPQGHDSEPQAYHQADPDPDRYDDALFGPMPAEPSAYEGQFPQENYAEGPFEYRAGYDDNVDNPPSGRRGGMLTVVAVLALAVVGTGAAFAYRTYVGSAPGAPPVIKADAEPNKIIPQKAGTGDAVGKLIQDRMSSANGTELMVSREEQPVDVKEATASGPRVVFPSLNKNSSPPPAAAMAPTVQPSPTGANGAVAGDEPRKVKTLSIHGDQADLAAAAVAQPAPSQAQPAPAAPPPAPAVTRRTPSAALASAGGNSPLSLSPQSEPRTRLASTNPSQQPAPAKANTGGYLVQISSQRNEADAKASFRTLQGKFPSVLGSRSPVIRRADLGARGVYYRAMVGPFGSSEEASHFCGTLKSAGGKCVVQRN